MHPYPWSPRFFRNVCSIMNHLSNCLQPRIMRNRYTGERIVVPCGHCASCLNIKANSWVKRLDDERRMWKYGVFFTLTYAPQYVPMARLVYYPDGKSFDADACNKTKAHLALCHYSLRVDDKVFQVGDDMRSRIKRTGYEVPLPYLDGKSWDFMKTLGGKFPVIHSEDFQLFFKRLRKNLFNLNKQNGKSEYETIRYFLALEYGPTSYRPHAHGIIFTNSDMFANNVAHLLSSSWPYDLRGIRYDFFESGCSKYVSKYLNCTDSLPQVLALPCFRPRSLKSIAPPLGTSGLSFEQVSQIFYGTVTEVSSTDLSKKSVVYTSLPNVLENRLFPRCYKYGQIDSDDRLTIYTLLRRFPSANLSEFEQSLTSALRTYVVSCIPKNVADLLRVGFVFSKTFVRSLYYCSKRFLSLCDMFSQSAPVILGYIEEYWKRKDYQQLIGQLKFSEDYCLDHPERVHDLACIDLVRLKDELDSYDYDEKPYVNSLEDTLDYKSMKSLHTKIYHDGKSSKVRKEYLRNHPEYAYLYGVLKGDINDNF